MHRAAALGEGGHRRRGQRLAVCFFFLCVKCRAMARRHVEWPETICVSNGQRVPSPYIQSSPSGPSDFYCQPCKQPLSSANHLLKKQHLTKAWFWCYGCTDSGYQQRAKAPHVVWETRETNERYWRDSPSSDEPQGGPQPAPAGRGWSARAASAAQWPAQRNDGNDPPGLGGAQSSHTQPPAASAAAESWSCRRTSAASAAAAAGWSCSRGTRWRRP